MNKILSKTEILEAMTLVANSLDHHKETVLANEADAFMKRVAYGYTNEAGEPIMDAAAWRLEQELDSEPDYDLDRESGGNDDDYYEYLTDVAEKFMANLPAEILQQVSEKNISADDLADMAYWNMRNESMEEKEAFVSGLKELLSEEY